MKFAVLIGISFLAAILEANAESCPKPENINCFRCQDQCYGDRDCGPGESCCRENCGNVCRKTTEVNEGTPATGFTCGYCPKPLAQACVQAEGFCDDECGVPDRLCDFGLVCCKEACGNRCRPESKDQIGTRADGPSCFSE